MSMARATTEKTTSAKPKTGLAWLVVTALSGAAALPAAASPYLLQPGDVLELIVTGNFGMRETLPVNIDGNVVAPLAGEVPAAGRSLEDIAGELRNRISQAAIPVSDGESVGSLEHVHPSLVSVSLRDYRPIYVDGQVREPGAHPFSPGLTARQAIALSGGMMSGARDQGLASQLIELEAQAATLKGQIAASAARIDRLRLESEGGTSGAYSPKDQGDAPTPESRAASLGRDLLDEDLRYLESAQASAKDQIESLRKQVASELEGTAADREEYDRLVAENANGNVTTARLNESRRNLVFTQSRLWETEARLSAAIRDEQSFTNMRNQRILKEQKEASIDLSTELTSKTSMENQLHSVLGRIGYILDQSDPRANTDDVVMRISRSDGSVIEIVAAGDQPLRPGDIIQVIPRQDSINRKKS